ncbi:MAG: N-acetylneuraminate synthase family protein [Acidobacteriota bacterium]|nr:N-acetylneuraminate synthase family protein [Acidobacteriota bacterium]
MKPFIFDENRCLVIGEIAQAHDGSLGTAHAYIDAVADAGADAIKFQTHIAAAESTPSEPFRIKFSKQDATRYDYWKRMEFTPTQWAGLAEHATERGLIFLSSPFSLEAVELLAGLDMAVWKIASGEVTNHRMLRRILATGKPVLLSSGMSKLSELDAAVEIIREHGNPFGVFQCTSAYPCPPEKVGLNVIPQLASRYNCPVGLSDHSGTIWPGIAALIQGARMLEIHVTMSREMFGPDVVASITTAELKQLVQGLRFCETMLAHPVEKDGMAGDLENLRQLFTRSVVAKTDLKAGTVLSAEHLTIKKPGTGIPENRFDELVGRTLLRDLERDAFLRFEDLEGA